MRKVTLCLAVATIMFATTSAHALTANVLASADSVVELNNPNTAFPSSPSLVTAKDGAPDTVSTDLRFFYAQFDLPGGLTGQDIATLNSTQLQVVRTGPNLSLTYYVYGILDGLDTASADTYTWNSGVGYDPANTLVKFLSVDEIDYYSDPAKSVFVGTLSTATPGVGPVDFTSTPQSPTAAADLQSLILNDTDGRLTFYVGIRQNFAGLGVANTFASIENPDHAGPTLILDYELIPEPTTAFLAVGSLFTLLLGGVRHRRDGKY